MAQIQQPSILKRILSISLVFIIISTFIIFLLGKSASGINQDIKGISKFLSLGEEIKPNFEQSLMMYTENTQYIIDYLLELRPDSEEEYITFISEIENIAQKLSLNIDMQSIENFNSDEAESNILDYSINFYGGADDMINFLGELEDLNYFIKVRDIDYKNIEFLDEASLKKENINMKIKLYTKEKNET